MADFVVEFTPRSHHICPVDLTGTTKMGMESVAGNAQSLIQDAQPLPKIDRSEEKEEETNYVTPSKNSSTSKNLVQSDSEGQTVGVDFEEDTSNTHDPKTSSNPSTC